MSNKKKMANALPGVMGVGLLASAFLGTFCSREETQKQPNIIFIMSDDHAYQAISAYGSKVNKTPNIDRLAEEGMRFDRCFVTNSISAPSRAVILTGKYSHVNKHYDNTLSFDSTQTTVPQLLQEVGYQTAIIGKWHLRSQPMGFDYWNILPGQGDYYNPIFIDKDGKKQHQGYVTDLSTDFALSWLDSIDQDKPFFLMLHNKAPHRNWMPALRHLHAYDSVKFPLPENFDDGYDTRSDAARQQAMTIKNHMLMGWDMKYIADTANPVGDEKWYQGKLQRMTPEQREGWNIYFDAMAKEYEEKSMNEDELALWKYQRYLNDYLGCINAVDENIGRVLDYLENKGLKENTMVVYTSDQGFYLGEHGWFDKRFMYEESFRTPLLVSYPKEIPFGVDNSDLVMNLDFAQTFLDYAGYEAETDMQGASLRQVLKGETPADWRDAVYYHYYEYPGAHSVKRHYGIRTDRYKLIRFYHDIKAWELYDLQNDPMEMNNLINNPDYQDLLKELKLKLKELQEKYGDSEEKAMELI